MEDKVNSRIRGLRVAIGFISRLMTRVERGATVIREPSTDVAPVRRVSPASSSSTAPFPPSQERAAVPRPRVHA
jgi:hypothetical protein